MAFIVPVVRKDYNLYGSSKNTPTLSKTGRSNSTPVRIISVESIERNFARQAAARRLRQNSSSISSSQNSPNSPATSQRQPNRRISIRHFSADSTESNTTTDSRRRVRFGHCEEIEFDSLESEDECLNDKVKRSVKCSVKSVQNTRSTSISNKQPQMIGARPRSTSLLNIEPPKQCRQPSKLSTFLKLAKLCSPGN